MEETHAYTASPSGQESYNIVIDYEFEHGVTIIIMQFGKKIMGLNIMMMMVIHYDTSFQLMRNGLTVITGT